MDENPWGLTLFSLLDPFISKFTNTAVVVVLLFKDDGKLGQNGRSIREWLKQSSSS